MSHDPRALLWDIQQAATLTASFLEGVGHAEFEGNALLRSAVERQLMIVGEAMVQLHKAAPSLAKALPDYRAVIGFRNVLVHGYAVVTRSRVWSIATHDLPKLSSAVDTLLTQLDGPAVP